MKGQLTLLRHNANFGMKNCLVLQLHGTPKSHVHATSSLAYFQAVRSQRDCSASEGEQFA